MDGIIIVNKPQGITSHDVINKIRKCFGTKKVGHAGTLDPMATGVLLVLIGKGTKLSNYLMEHQKTYIATIKLGEKTKTGDIEGEIIEKKEIPVLTQEKIKEVLKSFIGENWQKPPIYSAVKVKGKKLYEYARKGEEVNITPRKIEIYNMKLEKQEKETLTYMVNCSKGTYIRVLCEDIAQKLGTVGTMEKLIRTRVNNFSLEEAISLKELEQIKDKENTVIKIEEILKEMQKIEIVKKDFIHFLNGVQLNSKMPNGLYRIYCGRDFIGTGMVKDNLLKRDIILQEDV